MQQPLEKSNAVLRVPLGCGIERSYIADVVLGEFLGLSVRVVSEERTDWCLTDAEGRRCLIMPDSFFCRANEAWLKPESLPGIPLATWRVADDLAEAVVVESELPVIAGEPDPQGTWFSRKDEHTVRLGLDVLGSAFFMLTRYEELVIRDRDEHDRFPASASLAFRAGFLERPIIDEYVEVLWAAMHQLWPGLKRCRNNYEVFLTHDVDRPFGVKGEPLSRVVRRLGGDFLIRRDPLTAVHRLMSLVIPGSLGVRLDPNNTFDWLMDQAESYGWHSAFYFMAGKTSSYDSGYNLYTPQGQRLLRRIYERGHEIGIHPSYGTYQSGDLIAQESDALRKALNAAGILQTEIGGRHHYLRWDAGQTWQHWDEAGLAYDSTLSYAEHAGFRAGTCREFPVFAIRERRVLKLRERPLIVMDGTLVGAQYMGLSPDQALERIRMLSGRCRLVGGRFTLLWHNDLLITAKQKHFVEKVLEIVDQ